MHEDSRHALWLHISNAPGPGGTIRKTITLKDAMQEGRTSPSVTSFTIFMLHNKSGRLTLMDKAAAHGGGTLSWAR